VAQEAAAELLELLPESVLVVLQAGVGGEEFADDLLEQDGVVGQGGGTGGCVRAHAG